MKSRKKCILPAACFICALAVSFFMQPLRYAEGAATASTKESMPALADNKAEAEKEQSDKHGGPADRHEAHKDTPAQEENKGGHDHKEKTSDLDRTIDEMWAAQCEHGIIHYTCDECRYELGVVKLAPSVFGTESAPGVIAATTVVSRQMPRSFPLTGEVKAHENMTVNIASAVSGIIKKAAVSTGQLVAQGDVLLLLDSPDVAEAKGGYIKQLAALNLAKKVAEREERLFSKMVSAQADVETARAQVAQAAIDRANARSKLVNFGLTDADIEGLEHSSAESITGLLTVRAPHNGSVLERKVNTGERVEPGKPLLLFSDLSQVFVWADLNEGDLTRLNGSRQSVTAEVDSRVNPGKVYTGTLDLISGFMNEQTRTVRARIILENPDEALKPGMFVNVRLLVAGDHNVLAVPKSAVLSDEGREFVFTHKEGDYWIRRPVSLGETFKDIIEVKEGLSPGQKIIADGSFLLKSDVLRAKMGAGCAD